MRHLLPLLVLATVGCRKVVAAPTELDAVLHYLWSHAADGSDREVADGLENAFIALDGDQIELVEGSVSDLTAAEAAEVGISLDPAEATGGFVARPVACTMAQIETLLSHTAQDEIYDAYDAYARD